MDAAECKGCDPELWFPSRGDNKAITQAKAICAVCEVSDDCLAYAVENNERGGVWGGLTRQERLKLRRRPS